MPFPRPSLSELRAQVSQDLGAALPGSDPLLRFSNLFILAQAQAGMAHLHYGYLDWIAKQSNPFTATDEFLEAWAALKNVFRLPATSASGVVTIPGTNGTVVPAGTALTRSDGVGMVSTADATVSGGNAVISATVNADTTGKTGAFGNASVGTVVSLASPISGMSSGGTVTTAFTGGADIETDDALRARMLRAYQAPVQGGSKTDYEEWALQIPGVTRAWCDPNAMGAGTVTVRFMMDSAESAHGGFPQGTDGVAASETRATPATGDQLIVANYIALLQPVTALVYAVAPTANTVNFTISGISTASTATKAAISAAITETFLTYGVPGQSLHLSYVESAIAAVPGTAGFVIVTPSSDILNTTGQLPVLGTVTYT